MKTKPCCTTVREAEFSKLSQLTPGSINICFYCGAVIETTEDEDVLIASPERIETICIRYGPKRREALEIILKTIHEGPVEVTTYDGKRCGKDFFGFQNGYTGTHF